jgi:hypothetical protein
MLSKKLYEKKAFIYTIQIITILLILFTKLDLVLKLMLVFGYFMLFRQERWHKHLLIMFVMISILFTATHIYM